MILALIVLTAFRWGRFEETFTSAQDAADPLASTARVEFTGPGAKASVPLFWDGGRTWKVRFSPDRAGAWNYRVSAPGDKGLDGRRGAFRVTEYSGANPLYRHGPPRVSPDRRYLVHADGLPWFWLADTAWNGAMRANREEWDRYLADRESKKYTCVQFVTTQWRAGRVDENGEPAFSGVERVAVNPKFYQRLDARVDAVNEHGLVAAPVLLWALTSKDNESPGAALPPDQAIRLARYMVARYGAHHVVWILGGDGNYRGDKAERWKTIGRGVFPPGEPHAPATLHPGGMQDPWPEFRDESWLDLLMYQSGHGSDTRKWRWNATEGVAAGWKLEPPRPVIDGEINYERHLDYQSRQPISDFAVRRAAYYSLLAAPPAGVTYGAHGIWPWLREPGVPLDHPRTGTAPPWFECLDYPGARQMRVLHEVFESISWWKLRPDRTLLAEDKPDASFRDYAMPARSEECALIYLPANPTVKVNPGRFREAVWIDLRTGDRHPAGRLQPGTAELRTPGEGDWLLLLR